MKRFGYTIAILASSVLATACTDETEPVNAPPSGGTSGDESSTFDHDNDGISPWELLDRLAQEGPPSFTSRVHSCPKVKYATLGNILRSFGVTIPTAAPAGGDVTAGALYFTGDNAMGVANYANRIRENIGISTSGASREFDIFAAAADPVIANFAANTITRCPGATLFDTSNACQPQGITCLVGYQPTGETMSRYLNYCNLTVASASDPTVGKRLAVASMLAAAYTCE
jgi:hypothetical protein